MANTSNTCHYFQRDQNAKNFCGCKVNGYKDIGEGNWIGGKACTYTGIRILAMKLFGSC